MRNLTTRNVFAAALSRCFADHTDAGALLTSSSSLAPGAGLEPEPEPSPSLDGLSLSSHIYGGGGGGAGAYTRPLFGSTEALSVG